jgi:hypothetical protein
MSASANTPAGKIIILPSKAARVEYATKLNQSKSFDLASTFSEVIAPKKRDINVATDVAIIANMIILLGSISHSK